jgi:outer membrane protein assembly factor BamB
MEKRRFSSRLPQHTMAHRFLFHAFRPFPVLLLSWAMALATPDLSAAQEKENAGEAWDGLTFHQPPKPLPKGAITSDWPRFLGPADQPASTETKLLHQWPDSAGPKKVWECKVGDGYACPAIVGERLVHFHQVSGKEQALCLNAATGRRYWSAEYAIDYSDRYGYGNGPRGSAVIFQDSVVTFGVTSVLQSLELATGKVRWRHDCAEKFGVPKYFFGSGGTPLILDGQVILNLGGSDNLCVAALDVKSGELKWKAEHEWGQSYASPIPVSFHGQQRVLVFAGGESRPSTGGLLSIDPKTGKIDDAFPWRAKRFESVNASSPCLCGGSRVFVSQSYVDRDAPHNGGVMLEMTKDWKWKELWRAENFGCHWMNPVFHDGHLYAFSGEKDRNCELVCYHADSGKEMWRRNEEWDDTLPGGGAFRNGFRRGSLLRVDGAFLCLGEWGTLAWLDLTPKEPKILAKSALFLTQESWTLPAVSRGLLYVVQHRKDELSGAPPRLVCYDLRASEQP